MAVSDRVIQELVSRLAALELEVERLRTIEGGALYRGAQAGDFDTTSLPQHGDYGYQTTDNEVQMNCNGTVRAITTAAL